MRQSVIVLIMFTLFSPTIIAGGVTMTVDSTDDDLDFNNGTCSLREALVAAFTNSATDACPAGSATIPDRIVFDDSIFDANGEATIQQTSSYGIPDGEVFIWGPEDKTLTIMANGSRPVFDLVQTAGPRFELTNATLQGGVNAVTHGGAIEMGGEIADVTIDNVRFVGNRSDFSGGAIGFNGSENLILNISNSTFQNNEAGHFGGAIFLGVSAELTAVLGSSIFEANTADFRGGALYVQTQGSNDVDGSMAIEGNLFHDNEAASGGAVYLLPTGSVDLSVRVDGNGFHQNRATESFGGGLRFLSTRPTTEPTNIVVTRNVFRDNFAQTNGGAIRVKDAPFDIANNLFAHNTAGNSGALSISDNSATSFPSPAIVFNTFFENVGGTATDEVAAWDMVIELPRYAGNNLTISANAYSSPVSVSNDAPCSIDAGGSTISGNLQAILNTENADSCELHFTDGLFDDLGLQLIDVASNALQAVAEPKPGSPLIDVVTSSLCIDHDGSLLQTSLLGPRRDHDDVPINGDPRTAARCDVGSIEVDEGRLLSIDKTGTGSGTVTSSPEFIDCGAVCEGAFQIGTEMQLTASASAGSVFAGWSGPCSGTNDCIFQLNADTTATAVFEVQPSHTVTVEVLGAGVGKITSSPSGIQCPGACSADFVEDSIVTLHAVAGEGSEFSQWSGDCAGATTNECDLTVNSNLSAAATFDELPEILFRDRFEAE